MVRWQGEIASARGGHILYTGWGYSIIMASVKRKSVVAPDKLNKLNKSSFNFYLRCIRAKVLYFRV
jgi:hypothetical protein